MPTSIQVQRVASRHLAVVRCRAASSELATVVPAACGRVWSFIRSQQIPGAGRHVAVYFDGQINLEVGVELDGPFLEQGEVVNSSTPSGLVASTTHYGPYHKLASAHTAIRDFCESGGHSLAGPCWEIYGHWQNEWNDNPDQITTDVYYLLSDDGSTSA